MTIDDTGTQKPMLMMGRRRPYADEFSAVPFWGNERQRSKYLAETAQNIERRLNWIYRKDAPIDDARAIEQVLGLIARVPPAFYMELFLKLSKPQARRLSKIVRAQNDQAHDALTRRLRS